MTAWQPIETAPRGWKDILLFDPDMDDNEGVSQGYYSETDGGYGRWMSYYDGPCEPTHWIPLPPAPEPRPC